VERSRFETQDEILKGVEGREFFDGILNISKVMFDKAKEDYQIFTDVDLKEVARRNLAYFAVGLTPIFVSGKTAIIRY